MFLGGWLAGRYGGKHVIGIGLFLSSVATLLIPPAVRLNQYLIIVLRVIVGAANVSGECKYVYSINIAKKHFPLHRLTEETITTAFNTK